jgi:hypothetical protein
MSINHLRYIPAKIIFFIAPEEKNPAVMMLRQSDAKLYEALRQPALRTVPRSRSHSDNYIVLLRFEPFHDRCDSGTGFFGEKYFEPFTIIAHPVLANRLTIAIGDRYVFTVKVPSERYEKKPFNHTFFHNRRVYGTGTPPEVTAPQTVMDVNNEIVSRLTDIFFQRPQFLPIRCFQCYDRTYVRIEADGISVLRFNKKIDLGGWMSSSQYTDKRRREYDITERAETDDENFF